jgi:hypothetical protein
MRIVRLFFLRENVVPNILVIGQTPPPWHGQAIMIDHLVHAKYKDIEIQHIRMEFSTQIEDIGKISTQKVVKMFTLIARVYRAAWCGNIDYLYYPPAGPNKIPMLRDIAILLGCRWLLKKTIFHFHAGGISTLYAGLPRILRYFYRRAYFRPDLSIITSSFCLRDDQFLQSLRSVEIANGTPDQGRNDVVRNNGGEYSQLSRRT